ncbi:MAG: hypothetical protein ABR579_09825 [Actinomycetota bacterium]
MNMPQEPAGTPDRSVLPIGTEPPPPPAPSAPQSRLHALSISGMALCALLGIVSMIALITVRWPGTSERAVIALLIFCSIGFLASASIAVFSAARATYPRRPPRQQTRR